MGDMWDGRNQICYCNERSICLLLAGDFSLNYMPLYFNSMSMVNDTLCWTFTPVDDQRIEDTENFYFNVSTSNDLDIISTTSVFNIAISDNDGTNSMNGKIMLII